MKCINTVDAVGHVLCHDITRIVKDVVKDTAFRKGHIVQEEDIPVLLSLGKDHLYVWEKDENTLHENEAAQILCDVCINENMHPTDVKEGKIGFFTEEDTTEKTEPITIPVTKIRLKYYIDETADGIVYRPVWSFCCPYQWKDSPEEQELFYIDGETGALIRDAFGWQTIINKVSAEQKIIYTPQVLEKTYGAFYTGNQNYSHRMVLVSFFAVTTAIQNLMYN